MRALKITKQITQRDSESFSRYLKDVSRLNKSKSLTAEEEVELAKRIKEGDAKAEQELIERNLKFVVSVAKQQNAFGCRIEDLVNEGNIGLIKAAKKFDHTRGYKFISYAVWWVRQAMNNYIGEHGRSIRLPLNRLTQLNKIRRADEKFEQDFHRKPSFEELSEIAEVDMSSDEIGKILLLEKGCQSINAEIPSSISKNEAFCLEDLIPDDSFASPDESLDYDDLRGVINRILENIPKNHKTVIEMCFGLNGKGQKSLDEISDALGLSGERIRQIKNSALIKLKSKTNYSLIMQYIK